MPTVVYGDFEWEQEKADSNERKHGVTFEEAATVFSGDPLALDLADELFPERVVTIGLSMRQRLLFVVSEDRGPRLRIISAREASAIESRRYEEG